MQMAVPEYPTRRAEVEMEVMPDGSALLYDPRTDQGHVLTALGALTWDMCDGTMTTEAVASECASLLTQMPETAEIVHRLIGVFHQLHLLLEPEGAETV